MKKFAFIGAGSLNFTRDLVRDLMTFPAFDECELALVDIDEKRLAYAARGVKRIVEAGGHHARVTATTDRMQALKDADGVLITVLSGGVDVWRHDIEIPKTYGVDICVGDTRGPAGVFRFLRTAPLMLDILRDVEALCPNATVLNYTNPMAMLVSYLQVQTCVNVTGLCHSVQGTARMLAGWLGITPENLTYTCAGVNHQAFFLTLTSDGADLYPRLREAVEQPEIAIREQVRIEMFRQLGFFPTESSGHNSEYVPWFRKRPDLIETYCTHGTGWNPGAYAYIRDEYLGRENTWERDYAAWLEGDSLDLSRGSEYAANIFNAICGDHTPYPFNANLRNRGHITNIDDGACVEVPVVAERGGIRALDPVTLPQHLRILVSHTACVEELAVRAAIEGDPEKVFQAILFDPLTASVCSMAEIRRMTRQMMEQNAPYLGYFHSLKV